MVGSGTGSEAPTATHAMHEQARAAGPRVLVFWQGGSQSLGLPDSAISLTAGRSRQCDLRIDLHSVSRTHVTLHATAPDGRGERKLTIEDMGSSNGTRVNGRAMAQRARLDIQPGDVIEMGAAIMLVQRAGSDSLLPSGPPPPPAASPGEQVLASPPMQRLYRTLDLVAPSRINVLIEGETGAGKEVAARALHARSPRAAKPFIAVNCASMPEALLESELFGHERGAFTGAARAKVGLIEAAEAGTLLLDEVGEIPLALQAKLLRVIDQRELRRVGSVRAQPIDVRFVAATNRSLEAMVEAGAFRRDLFFRLNGLRLHVPPLRERTDDIEPLAQHFIAIATSEQRLSPAALSPQALATLRGHSWPGNVRELRNAIERAVVLCQGRAIAPEHLLLQAGEQGGRAAPQAPEAPGMSLKSELEAIERDRIVAALEQTGGNQTRAAELLGMSRRTLVKRLTEYNIPRPRKRRGS